MPKFNTNAYNLKNVNGRDPLFGPGMTPGDIATQNAARDHGRIAAPRRRVQSNPLGRALAGSRVRSGARGGRFAPRAVSGMS